jgi:hypothetical protein
MGAMLMPRTSGAIVLAAALAAAAAAPAAAQTLSGRWSGVVSQSGPDGRSGSYVAVLVLAGAGGTMDYPTLECGGDVAFVSKSGAASVYRETITHGQGCLAGGAITVQPGGPASVVWSWTGQPGVTAHGRLYKLAAPRPAK